MNFEDDSHVDERGAESRRNLTGCWMLGALERWPTLSQECL